MLNKIGFNIFHNLYPVTKTLRWELNPVWRTLEYLKREQWILYKDNQRDQNYKAIKPILDELHNLFITESLEKSQIDRSNFFTYYIEYKKAIQNRKSLTEKDKKELETEFESLKKWLRKDLWNFYNQTANEWKLKFKDWEKDLLKENGYKILTEAWIQKVLENIYKDNKEKLEIIRSFSWFWTYFSGFNQNRENYYTTEWKSTEIVFRIVDQNLITFCNNILLKEKTQEIWLTNQEQEIFDISYYNQCLTQQWIDKYNYILWGQINADGKRITDGINQRINQYNQQHKTKIPQLTVLYKQIWSLNKKWKLFDSIEDDKHLHKIFDEYFSLCDNQLPQIQLTIKNFFDNQQDLEKIWISKANLNWISNIFFANWSSINDMWLKLEIFGKKKDSNKERQIKIPEYVSLADLKNILENVKIEDQSEVEEEKRVYLFKKQFEEKRNWEKNDWKLFIKLLSEYRDNISGDLYKEYKNQLIQIQNSFDKNNQEHKNIIKNYADKTIEILRFMKLFRVDPSKRQKETSDFTKEIDVFIQNFSVSTYYDLIRNYLTKKPFSIEKMKLNFDCSTLLDGWDKNKETQNLSVILKDKDWYYLAIIKKDKNKFFEEKNTALYNEDVNIGIIQKMEYKLLPWPNKMLPKCLMPWKEPKKYWANDEILDLYQRWTFKKWDTFDRQSMEKIIDFFKKWLKMYEDWQIFDFQFKKTEDYEDISKFYAEVEKQWYKLSRKDINKQKLMHAVEEGKIYLFQISSKDFTKKNTTSKQDLQTVYRTSMLSGNTNIKLNWWAEIFFRPASIKEKKQKDLLRSNDQAIEHKRYTEDKILFHCPITLNFWSQKITRFNDFTNEYLKNNEVNIIWIDRWEKHLNFYSVINTQGEILEQGTLNIIEINYKDKNGKEVKKHIDYGKLLDDNAKDRLYARQNRETIGKIKELKEWYISQVVKKISDLVFKYNAIIILENLNTWFKNSRKKIEKSVYQNLEVALAKKLSLFVDKNIENWKPWSVTNPYQLCPVTGLFGDIERATQRWIMLYTRANYTSTTDPITWRRKTIYIKKWTLADMKKWIDENFKSIWRDNNKNAYFVKYGKRTLRSNVERRRGKQDIHGQRQTTKYNPTEEFDKLFSKNWIDKNWNILERINKSDLFSWFYSSLIWIIDLIMQIRNSDKDGNDFIFSCVEDKNWKKFDSREYYKLTDLEKTNNVKYPTSWDANGAYNIARKWILVLEKIKKWENKLYVSDEEWGAFSQK